MNQKHDCSNLQGYLMDELTPEMKRRFDAHLAACTPCARAVAADRMIRNALAELPRVAAPHRFTERVMADVAARQRNRAAWFVYAAALVVLAMMTTILTTGSLAPLAREGGMLFRIVADTGASLYTAIRNVSATLYAGLDFGRFTPIALIGTVLVLAGIFLKSLTALSATRRH